jgi:hypothetical protein
MHPWGCRGRGTLTRRAKLIEGEGATLFGAARVHPVIVRQNLEDRYVLAEGDSGLRHGSRDQPSPALARSLMSTIW